MGVEEVVGVLLVIPRGTGVRVEVVEDTEETLPWEAALEPAVAEEASEDLTAAEEAGAAVAREEEVEDLQPAISIKFCWFAAPSAMSL